MSGQEEFIAPSVFLFLNLIKQVYLPQKCSNMLKVYAAHAKADVKEHTFRPHWDEKIILAGHRSVRVHPYEL